MNWLIAICVALNLFWMVYLNYKINLLLKASSLTGLLLTEMMKSIFQNVEAENGDTKL